VILLDTNIVSELMRATPDPFVLGWIDRQRAEELWTTSISIYELQFGIEILPEGRRRQKLHDELIGMVRDDLQGRIAPFDRAAAAESARLAAWRRKTGRSIDLHDGHIAGIALACRATIATRNIRDFQDLAIPVIDPFQPQT